MRLAVLAIVGSAMLAGLFWWFRPAPTPAPVAQPAVATMEIRQGRRATGPEVIRARQGEPLRIRVLSDQDAELHLHGYDLRAPLRAGVPAELSFVAAHSGRFELELHGAGGHAALGVIEVAPR